MDKKKAEQPKQKTEPVIRIANPLEIIFVEMTRIDFAASEKAKQARLN